VLPIESSLVGPVNETHDLLYDSALSIVAEAILPIRHCLVGPAQLPLEDVREIRSHAVALDQCRRLLASMPWATAVVAATTGDAAAAVAELGEPSVVAIASVRAAGMHGLAVIADDVGDHAAYTRFAALAPYTRLDRRHGEWRTALTFETHHRPGALHHAIEPLARRSIDMVQLVSRPIPSRPFDYRFDCVLGGHPLDDEVAAALAEMQAETARLRVFGSYRADRDEGWETVAA
jgi:prephenate dehydratase